MVDDVRNITETAESKEALDRSKLARERREAEQRKRLDELRAHAAAAQAQREKRDEDRRKRQADQRAKDDDRRVQVEERKRAIWEASISRREALLQRERDRAERLVRARAARSAPRPAFAFGSSTPRLLDPLDSAGFFWAARSTNPIDQMNFFESLAASTTNVMFVSAPLTRRASALQLDTSDTDNKDEPDRAPAPPMWSSVARRRTDLVPTVPLGRAPGRAHSMTRLDRLPPQRPIYSASPSMHHLNRTQCRSGETTPGSRPGSALSNAAGVVRRPASSQRKPRPASIAGTGVNTPRGGVGAGGDVMSQSLVTTPSVSRDSTVVGGGGGDVLIPRRPATTPRRPRPASMHAAHKPATPAMPGEGKPPVHRKPKPSKEHDKSGSGSGRGKSMSASPGRTLSPTPVASKDSSVDKELPVKLAPSAEMPGELTVSVDWSQISAEEVTQKLEALQVNSDLTHNQVQIFENKELVDDKWETRVEPVEKVIEEKTSEPAKPVEIQKPVERKEERGEKREEKKEPSQEKTEENEMTGSMTARRITTEVQAKAALAERRKRAREELERQADLERQRLQQEAEEEVERQLQEEERQRREEEEARELAQLQRRMDEEKLRKAIEVQQQLERDEAERKTREESERQARLREDEEKRKAAEEAEKLRREEAEKEEKERLARKQRVEAIMARTRLRKAEEEKKHQDKAQSQAAAAALPAPAAIPLAQESTPAVAQESIPAQEAPAAVPAPESVPVVVEESPAAPEPATAPGHDNGNLATVDLLGFDFNQVDETKAPVHDTTQTNASTEVNATVTPNNGNVTADLLGLSEQNNTEDKIQEQSTQKQIDNSTSNTNINETNNGNVHLPQNVSGIGHISANFLQTERTANENQTKMAEVPKLLDDDFITHNGHGTHNHPLTLQNAI